ncbi:MAG: response regulator, partial [Synergistaceae bacterium]|nr:response regulator [Synergistaceae bacterium]
IGKMLSATRDGEVIVPFAESAPEDISFMQSEAVRGFYRSMHREMEVSVAAARTFQTERGELLLFEAEIPGTDYLLMGFVPKEKASEGIENITLLVVWVFGLLMLLVAIGSMYLVRVRVQVQESEELREAKAAAEKASQAKSDFLSNMSHEIRTPINAVLGMNEMVLRESHEQNVIEYSENIRTAGSTLLGIINDILDFSKIEAGKMDILPADYDLFFLINDLVNMIQARAEDKSLRLELDFDETLPRRLNGDEVRIRQVITNILTNAVKYTKEGSVTFHIGYERIEDDPVHVLLNISISDTGIGIKPEDLAKLFSEFERIEEKRNRSIEGTGLGMSITKRLLEMMGTSLKVESIYGEGSTFSFQLRQKVVSWEPLGSYEDACRTSPAERKKYHEKFTAPDALVLMVDDTPMNLAVFRSLLKRTKIQIDTAASGDEGLKLMKAKKYDVIFLDHMMPDKDGIETLHELKSNTANTNLKTPVICLTANAISGARERYLAEGFDDYLTKPIDAGKLEEILTRYLPPEKLMAPAGDVPGAEPAICPEWLRRIDEVDTGIGLKNCGGEEAYLETLKIYGEDAAAAADRIEDLWRARDIANTTIKVHALKSTSRAIGAVSLGALAEKLEFAGKAGDEAALDAELNGLLARYRALGAALSPLYAPRVEAHGDLPPIAEDVLREAYDSIREFAENFDMEGAECALNYLDGFRIPEGERERVGQLRGAIRGFDWGRVNEILS